MNLKKKQHKQNKNIVEKSLIYLLKICKINETKTSYVLISIKPFYIIYDIKYCRTHRWDQDCV